MTTDQWEGMNLQDAIDLLMVGYKQPYRVVRRDGHGMMKTNDMRNDRLNFEVEDDVITGCYLG